jgi:hypothetical protein
MFWVLLIVSLGVCLVAFGFPMWVIQPFSYQDPKQLAWALQVKTSGLWVAPIAALVAVFSAVQLWKAARKWTKFGVAALGLLAVAAAGLTHVNVYEQMFHPIDEVKTVSARLAKLAKDEMVLAIDTGGEARAYPVGMMAYHHVVNDYLGGVPLVGTY